MSADEDRPDAIHEEILRHLRDHPPSAKKADRQRPQANKPEKPPRKPPQEPKRPQLHLRRLRLDLALERLTHFLQVHRRRGTPEILVIVGRGKGSPGGEPVVGPAVRSFCDRHPEWVAGYREADAKDGGSGALVIRLAPPPG